MEILNACEDGINQDTVYVTEYLGSTDITKVILDYTRIFDQYKDGNGMGCTVYGLTHDKHDTEKKETLVPNTERQDAVTRGASITKGWSLAGALRMFKDKGYIKAYALTKGVDAMKSTLIGGTCIYTGSSKIDWRATKARSDKMVVVVKSGAGHAYAMNGFNDNREDSDKKYKGAFHCKNSSDSFPEFRVPYDLIDCLFSTIEIFVDKEKAEEVKKNNEQETIDYAILKGITNGKDLDMNCVRGNAVVMLMRVDNPGMEYMQALKEAKENGLWNGLKQQDAIKREHLMIMCGRYLDSSNHKTDEEYIEISVAKGITNGTNKSNDTTRREAILMIARVHKSL